MKRIIHILLLAFLLSAGASPVLAGQGGGGVHFGPYSLSDGDTITGDLVVFGPVNLGENSRFDGDLVAFGTVNQEEGALLIGDLVCAGAVMIAGTVEGDVFAAGTISLGEGAIVEGDVSAIGEINQDEGALIEGQIEPMDPGEFEIFFDETPMFEARRFGLLVRLGRGLLTVVILAIFALIIGSIWPTQMRRIGDTLVNEPVTAFGVGALALFLGFVLTLVLFVTICLIPFGLLVAAIVGVGVVLGWVSLGYILGERLLQDLFHVEAGTPATASLLGTTLLTLLLVTVRLVSGCAHTLLILPLFSLVGGAVTLTRFGTMPYATQGVPRSVRPQTPSALVPREPPAPTPPAPTSPPSEPPPFAMDRSGTAPKADEEAEDQETQ